MTERSLRVGGSIRFVWLGGFERIGRWGGMGEGVGRWWGVMIRVLMGGVLESGRGGLS